MLLEDDAFLLLEELKRTKDGKIEQLSREKQRLAYGARPSPPHTHTRARARARAHTERNTSPTRNNPWRPIQLGT